MKQNVPNVVDGVEPAELSEESGVGNVAADVGSATETAGPVVGPVVHTPWKTEQQKCLQLKYNKEKKQLKTSNIYIL